MTHFLGTPHSPSTASTASVCRPCTSTCCPAPFPGRSCTARPSAPSPFFPRNAHRRWRTRSARADAPRAARRARHTPQSRRRASRPCGPRAARARRAPARARPPFVFVSPCPPCTPETGSAPRGRAAQRVPRLHAREQAREERVATHELVALRELGQGRVGAGVDEGLVARVRELFVRDVARERGLELRVRVQRVGPATPLVFGGGEGRGTCERERAAQSGRLLPCGFHSSATSISCGAASARSTALRRASSSCCTVRYARYPSYAGWEAATPATRTSPFACLSVMSPSFSAALRNAVSVLWLERFTSAPAKPARRAGRTCAA
jgi:hypothetical protein